MVYLPNGAIGQGSPEECVELLKAYGLGPPSLTYSSTTTITVHPSEWRTGRWCSLHGKWDCPDHQMSMTGGWDANGTFVLDAGCRGDGA